TARLRFDKAEAALYELHAGVPQGSPLSSILFNLYLASLYETLYRDGLQVVGFADDTNLITYNSDIAANYRRLESAWITYENWARTRGITFAPEKSELIYFSRAQAAPQQKVRLSGNAIKPVELTKFLGIWFDR